MDLHSTFEYHDFFQLPDRAAMEKYLNDVWQQYIIQNNSEFIISEEEGKQQFLSFDGNKARAKNFIGIVQTEDCHIEIYPKIFKKHNKDNVDHKKLFLRHIFYWFDYCRKWKFPFTNVDLALLNDIDLPELIINLMTNRIFEVISNSPISLYQEVEEALMMPRGRINFTRYLSNGFSNGNQHILECDYEPLVFDNALNRVIKYVARILQQRAKFSETQHKLSEIIFILDEVEDVRCTIKDLNSVKFNTFFSDYKDVTDICRMVLEQQMYSNNHHEHSQWCMLFPMEYIFEDFIAGFLETHFSEDWKVEYQKSNMNLSNGPEAFNMQQDVFLTSRTDKSVTIIVDTKYKLRSDFKNDVKKGIEQSDMYQMTSYALRRGCKNVLLLYPNFSEIPQSSDSFIIESGFKSSTDKIKITAAEIPFWSMDDFNKDSLEERLRLELHDLINTVAS